MSRIGKKPVSVPSNVTATVSGQNVKMKGPKGELSFNVPEVLKVAKTAEGVELTPIEDTKPARSKWGMSRTQIANLIKGVTDGYTHDLEIHGVGFKASMKGKNQIVLSVGYSHDVVLDVPAGVDVKVGGAKQELVNGFRDRQAGCRTDGRRDPLFPQARALPGQGRALQRRIHLPQGRQEEIRTAIMANSNEKSAKRQARVRRSIKKNSSGRPRLSVHRSSEHIYAQVIDDAKGTTLAAASSMDKTLKGALKSGANKAAAAAVGKLVAERAVKAGVKEVVFDRGAFLYHGRVKALADAAREGGLKF